MRHGLTTLAILGTIGIGTAGAASAQTCPPGQMLQAGICRPAAAATAAPAPRTAVAPPATRAPAMAPGVTAGRAAHPYGPTTTTTVRTGSTVAPAPVASTTAGAATEQKVCPAGFTLYKGGCASTQDYQTAIFK